jgi:hypothetical protein
MAKLVLWGVNRAARWKPEPLRRALALQGLFAPTHEVVLGSRAAVNREATTGPAHALQYEQAVCDEYFVPIVVKALGDPQGLGERLGAQLGSRGKERLEQLCSSYPEYFGEAATAPWRDFWTLVDSVGMFTSPGGNAPYRGLYEVVWTQREQGAKAVLVGYSQGGLLARFLAFLDEFLMPPEHRCIAGVVTVQAPNAGSPLADPSNADNVARGIFEALSGFAGIAAGPRTFHRQLDDAFVALANGRLAAADGPRHFDIEAVSALLDAAIADAATLKKSADTLDVLKSARRWMSGLSPMARHTAFADLNTSELDRPGRILNVLASSGLVQTFEGAVIGTDNGLKDVLVSLLPWYAKGPAAMFSQSFGLDGRLALAVQAYSGVSLNEAVSGEPLTPLVKDLAADYENGCTVLSPEETPLSLPALAHDFVITSVSQSVGPRGAGKLSSEKAPYFLGNLVNAKGTHISGADENDPGNDLPRVAQLLKAMGKRIEHA